MSTIPSNSQVHFQWLIITQEKLAKLQAKEVNTRTTLINIQSMFLPHMEVMKHELSIIEALMSCDANILIEEGLVDLETTLEIQIHTLEVARHNWELTLAMLEQVNKTFWTNTL